MRGALVGVTAFAFSSMALAQTPPNPYTDFAVTTGSCALMIVHTQGGLDLSDTALDKAAAKCLPDHRAARQAIMRETDVPKREQDLRVLDAIDQPSARRSLVRFMAVRENELQKREASKAVSTARSE